MNLIGTSFKIVVDCKNNEIAEIIYKGLEPENKEVDSNTTIEMELDNNRLTILLESKSEISTIRNTIDDILSTINTIESVYKSVK